MGNEPKCIFCGLQTSHFFSVWDIHSHCVSCPVCGDYDIAASTWDSLRLLQQRRQFLVNCIAENIRLKKEGRKAFWTQNPLGESPIAVDILRSTDEIGSASTYHSGKPLEVLRTLSTKVSKLGAFGEAKFDLVDAYELRIDGYEELYKWLVELIKKGWIENSAIERAIAQGKGFEIEYLNRQPFKITPTGWLEVERLFGNPGSKRVLIAMAFDPAVRQPIEDAIRAACKENGWDAFPIDKEEYQGGVTDAIIARIRQSRFIVADYTLNKAGVYYEAGYAEGRGITVISTVREDFKDQLHFDVRHLNFIIWKDPKELHKRLADRIGSSIP